jgi:cyclic beta-1,2-glucan synthetase
MVKDRRPSSCVLLDPAILLLAALLPCCFALAGCAPAPAMVPAVRLLEAAERGTFNVGRAHATAEREFDPASGGDVLRLDYAIPSGAAAGVYAKAFPGGLGADRADLMRLGVKAADPDQARNIAVAVEIKGSAGLQRIPVEIHRHWRPIEEIVDWHSIGDFREVVCAVSRTGDDGPATGTILIDARFEQLSFLRQLSMSPGTRLGGVFLASLLCSLLVALWRATIGRWPEGGLPGDVDASVETLHPPRVKWPRLLLGDLVRGAGLVFILLLAMQVYFEGAKGRLEVGWAALGVAVGGAAVAEWWKYGLTGRHLTAPEVFQDMFASGLLATSSSPMAILQAPATWSEPLLLSQPVAVVAALVYHAANAYRLAAARRHLGAVGAALILGSPYVLGGLTILESSGLLQALGSGLSAGLVADRPAVLEFAARTFLVFCFNELVAAGIGLATKRTLLKSMKAHLTMLAVAAAVVASPWVAVFGSGAMVASWPVAGRLLATVLSTIVSQAGLWGEAYLITGMAMDAIHGQAPSRDSVSAHPIQGMKKGMVYSGTFMGILQLLGALWEVPLVRQVADNHPLTGAVLFGALSFPLLKTIIESFDGSQAFFRRARRSYQNPTLYLRGACVGLGVGWALSLALHQKDLPTRAWFGFGIGALVYAGGDLFSDLLAAARGRGRLQRWRVYFLHALLGGFIGAAIGFYLDASQVSVVTTKFHRYLAAGLAAERFEIYPLISKWGHLNLGTVTGGVSLLFMEALAGVISWSTAAWLFAINRTFMRAYFWKDATPIRTFFTREGLSQLAENMIQVLRWGLWMSPIINSFLRPMGTPTWYNQDGAIRTAMAIAQDATTSALAFRAWSLQVFIDLLAYDAVRILIWLDHMGLRVATLVNLSFLGMDRLEQRLARFLAPAATARCIPEGVKRFTTWAPLLIPYYIPRGPDWDHAWSAAEAIRSRGGGGVLAALFTSTFPEQLLLLAASVALSTAAFSGIRWLRTRSKARSLSSLTLRHTGYEVTVREDGAVESRVPGRDYDLSRRSYDLLDPAGRALFLVDTPGAIGRSPRAWPVIGNFPSELAEGSRLERSGTCLRVHNEGYGLKTTVEISLPGAEDPVELWTITVENLADSARSIKVVPYIEWVLSPPQADRGHTQYNRLFAEIEYSGVLHAVLAWDKHSKAMGILAADRTPEGFLSSRIDFIGRARSLWTSRVLETLAFSKARDTAANPTLDPIGSLLCGMTLPARGTSQMRLLLGLTREKNQAIDLIARHLQVPGAGVAYEVGDQELLHRIGHGEIPPGTSQPYFEYSEDGRRLLVRTPFTPRPFDHTMSNGLGHVAVVTNRGLHTSASVNAQQNRLTPDWSDIVAREVPAEAFYLYDPEGREWFSPTYHPLNMAGDAHEAEFGIDGTATFRMSRGVIETELTVFVPPDEPTAVYLLTIRNLGHKSRPVRLSPYFQVVLAGQPEYSGPLRIHSDEARGALFFENPRNTFRTGSAFVAISRRIERVETQRGRFFGLGRSVAHPYLLEHGEPDTRSTQDTRPIAAMLCTIDLPARGECTVVVLLGQADDREQAEAVIRKYGDPAAALAGLQETRRWWLSLLDTLRVETTNPEFDQYLNWLKYQALAERIWARRGFYQASGAYGFRDQLQDSVNLIWMDPVLARRQILLHASQQFTDGDVVHWFHRLQDGRTGFVGRTYASDNLLWLAWGVVEYVGATSDESLLDERTLYLEAEQPLLPLPAGKDGMGLDPLRSSREDTVYRHCLKAIDLVLAKRMGAHGLPLMGTGDWNDGLDDIGSQGRGESVWLGFFLSYILDRMAGIIAKKEGRDRQEYYLDRLGDLNNALELTWRGDRYLRAIHDDGTEIGVKDSGVWEIDALTAAWAVMSGINRDRGQIMFKTALSILEKENTILLGWPPLREDTKPYLGRSSVYPEGVRENGMYCHGVQWLVAAARILAEHCRRQGRDEEARRYLETAARLWFKISPIPHTVEGEIETYGGQPNKQAADMVTTFDPGRMIWNGYTGAAGWMLRQALEGVLGLRLLQGEMVPPSDLAPAGELSLVRVSRDTARSPLNGPAELRPPAQHITTEQSFHPE